MGRLRRYGNAFIVMSPHPRHVADVPVEIKNVELCSTFENVPDTSPSCPRRCGDSFLNGNQQICDWRRRGRLILHLEIHNNAFETQNYIIKLQKQAYDDITGTRPRRLRGYGNHIIVSVPAASPIHCWDTSPSLTTIWKPGFTFNRK